MGISNFLALKGTIISRGFCGQPVLAFGGGQAFDGVAERDAGHLCYLLQGTGLPPNLMQRDLLLGSDEPVDATLESVSLSLPTSGNSTWISGFFQDKRPDA